MTLKHLIQVVLPDYVDLKVSRIASSIIFTGLNLFMRVSKDFCIYLFDSSYKFDTMEFSSY